MRKSVFLAGLAWAVVLGFPSLGGAAIWFELPQMVALTDGSQAASGVLDVLVRADAANLPQQIGSFNLDFHVSSTQVTLGPPQAAPNPLLTGAPTNFSPNAQTLRAARAVYPSSAALADGKALVRVPFSVAAGVTGTFALSFGSFNELADSSAASLSIATTDVGSISVALLGDYDRDADVDGTDFLVWQRMLGSAAVPKGAGADGNSDGMVNGQDLAIWRNRFAAAHAATERTAAAVPEPATSAIALAGTITLALARGRAAARRRRDRERRIGSKCGAL
jgi:hypothetical protein